MPIKELYYDIIEPHHLYGFAESSDSDGKFIISDSKLYVLLPPKVQLMSNQIRYLCVYGTFILSRLLPVFPNVCLLKYIIHIEQLAEYRGQTRYSGIFQ